MNINKLSDDLSRMSIPLQVRIHLLRIAAGKVTEDDILRWYVEDINLFLRLLQDHRQALMPFAVEAVRWRDIPGEVRTHDNWGLSEDPNHHTKLCVGDLRKAYELLKP